MAAPTLIQSPSVYVTGSNTSETITGTVGSWDQAVAAGSTLILVIQNSSSNDRSYGCSDDVDGTWDDFPVSKTTDSRQTKIFYKRNHTGGTVNVTVTSNFNIAKTITLVEISESWVDVYSRNPSVAVDGTNGYPSSADSTVIDTSTDVFVIAALTLTASGVISTASAPWTELYNNGTNKSVKYRTSATALTDERGYFEETGTNRFGCAAIAAFTSNITLSQNTDAPNITFQNTQQFFTSSISPTTVVIGTGHLHTTLTSWLTVDPKPYAAYTIEIDGTVTETTSVNLNKDYFQGQLLIKPVAGQEHRGKPGTGAKIYFNSGTQTQTFTLGARTTVDGVTNPGSGVLLEDYHHTIIQDLEIEGNSSTINTFRFITLNGNYSKKTVQRCLIHGSRKSATNNDHGCVVVNQGLTNITIQSNIIYNATSVNSGGTHSFGAISISAHTGGNSKYTKLIQNNTIYDVSTDGANISARGIIFQDNATVKVYNNIVNNITNSAAGSALCYNISSPANSPTGGNIADDTSSPDSLNSITVDFVNTTSGSEDFHITNSTNNQTNVIGQGDTTIDLLGYQDIDGDYRSNVTPDIGADEYDQFFVNQNQFFGGSISAQVGIDLDTALYQNAQQFFSHVLAYNLDAALYQNTQQFFEAAISPTKIVIGNGASADYNTLEAWYAAAPTAGWPGASYTIEIDGTCEHTTDGSFNFNKDYFWGQLLIKPVDGQENRGVPGSGAILKVNTTGSNLTSFAAVNLGSRKDVNGNQGGSSTPFNDRSNTIIQDLEIVGENNGDGTGLQAFTMVRCPQEYSRYTIQRCLIHGLRRSGPNNDCGAIQTAGLTAYITILSNIIYDIKVNSAGSNDVCGINIQGHNSGNDDHRKYIENNTITGIEAEDTSTTNVRGILTPDSQRLYVYNNIVNNLIHQASGTNTCYNLSAPTNVIHSGNISDDATSPDTSLRNIDLTFRALDATNNPGGTITGHYALEETDTAAMGQATVGSMPDDVKGAPRWRYSHNDLPQTSISNITTSNGSSDVTVTAAGHNLSVGGWVTVHGTGSSNFDSSPSTPKCHQVTAVSGNDITYVDDTLSAVADSASQGTLTQIVWDIGADQFAHRVIIGNGSGTVTNAATDTKYSTLNVFHTEVTGIQFYAKWYHYITGDAINTGYATPYNVNFAPNSYKYFAEGLVTAYPGEETNGKPYNAVTNPNKARLGRNSASTSTAGFYNASTYSIGVPRGVFAFRNLELGAFNGGGEVNYGLALGGNYKDRFGVTGGFLGSYSSVHQPRMEATGCLVHGIDRDPSYTSGVSGLVISNFASNRCLVSGNIIFNIKGKNAYGINNTRTNTGGYGIEIFNNTVSNIKSNGISGTHTGCDAVGIRVWEFSVPSYYYNNLVTDIGSVDQALVLDRKVCFSGSLSEDETGGGIPSAGYNLSDDATAPDFDTPTFSISNITGNSGNGTVSVTTTASHGYSNGDRIAIAETTNFNGSFIISNASGTTFDYSDTNSNLDETSGTTRKTTSIHYATITFRDAANDDYHLASTDTEAIGAGTNTIDLYQDIDGDYRSNVTPDIGADEYDEFFINQNQFFGGSISVQVGIDLDAALYQNSQQFFSHALELNLSGNLYQNNQQFFSHALAYNLDAALYQNTQQFFSHALELNLSGNLFQNQNVVFESNIGGVLAPDLISQTNQFFTHEIKAQKLITFDLYQNTQQFFVHSFIQNLNTNLYQNSQQFFSHTAQLNLDFSLFQNNQQFFISSIEQNLDTNLYQNTQQFFSHSVEQNLNTNLYQNSQQFFSHDIKAERLITANLYQNAQQFFGHESQYNLNANVYQNSQKFFGHDIKAQKLIEANLYKNQNIFFESAFGGRLGANLILQTNQFFTHDIKAEKLLNSNLVANNNQFFNHTFVRNLNALLVKNTNQLFTGHNINRELLLTPNLYKNENEFFNSEFERFLNANLYKNTNQFNQHLVYGSGQNQIVMII